MQITFRNKKLQKSCSVEKEAVKAYGDWTQVTAVEITAIEDTH